MNFLPLINSKTVVTMAKQLEELNQVIETLILDSYGLGVGVGAREEEKFIMSKTLLRKAPSEGEHASGLHPPTDKLMNVILCDGQIDGLEIQTKDSCSSLIYRV